MIPIAHRRAPGGRPRLVVPAYFHPALDPGGWQALAEHAPALRLVVLNLASGPGTAPDAAFLPALERLRAAKVTIVGYVDTGYGRRPPGDALDELARYRDFYDVTDVSFDQVAAGQARLAYYADLARRARDMGARTVVFNHGTHPAEAYAQHADLLGTFEGPWSAYRRASVPRWTRSHPPGRFYHLVYSVPPGRVGQAFRLAGRRGAGSAYVTDLGGANPWARLPACGLTD